MEVGAVKQAFNNELIRLKKNLNQARIQIIHKLTRKAKTLTEKKAPEKLKEKLKRKAESAVNEVLIIKRIKIRDLAKFMLTHTGELNTFLNKPKVDTEKACARLLLHNTLNNKYQFIRNRFASVPINDLLMSREERRKIKKEAKEKQKNKKKGKNNNELQDNDQIGTVEGGKEFSDDDSEVSGNEISDNDDKDSILGNTDEEKHNDVENDDNIETANNNECSDHNDNSESDIEKQSNVEKIVELQVIDEEQKPETSECNQKPVVKINHEKPIDERAIKKKPKGKDVKNKNLNEKLISRKFKKEEDTVVTANKVVDPFFITATGESYLTVAEPRAPDEFKEIHRQGNRQLRRAAMFGHAPKIKRNYDDYNSNRFNQSNRESNDQRINRSRNYNNKHDKFNKNERFNPYNVKNEKNSSNNNKKTFDAKPEAKGEKLHPSWEAKKKQSGILPFQGKKIVFGDS